MFRVEFDLENENQLSYINMLERFTGRFGGGFGRFGNAFGTVWNMFEELML